MLQTLTERFYLVDERNTKGNLLSKRCPHKNDKEVLTKTSLQFVATFYTPLDVKLSMSV